MPPKGKGKGKGEGKSKANDAPKSSSPKKKTGSSKSPRKPKPIPEDSAAESSSSTPKKKKPGSSKSPNKRKKNTEESAESRVSENEPIIDPFYDLLNPSPTHNEYLEHAMFFQQPKIEEPEIPDVPPILPPGFEELPRSFGGLEEIVESAKQLNRKKD